MSVEVCEDCGCGEFGHDRGVYEELPEEQWDQWQTHECSDQCDAKCLLRLCRDGDDGWWMWCKKHEMQCSGRWVEDDNTDLV
jgi:hypothetical protein